MKTDTLLRTFGTLPEAEVASMLLLAATELAYRRKTSIGDIASMIDGLDPWEPREDPASHEVRPMLTLAGDVWERITGRRRLQRRRRLH